MEDVVKQFFKMYFLYSGDRGSIGFGDYGGNAWMSPDTNEQIKFFRFIMDHWRDNEYDELYDNRDGLELIINKALEDYREGDEQDI